MLFPLCWTQRMPRLLQIESTRCSLPCSGGADNMKKLAVVLLVLPLLVACPKTKQQEKPAEQPQQNAAAQVMEAAPYAFAVADSSGKRLRNLGTSQSTHLENPASFTHAVCSDGPLLTIKYTGQREPAPDNTYRDTLDNFDKMGGHYYQVVDNKTDNDQICLMTDAGFYKERKLIATRSLFEEKLPAEAVSRIEKARGRKIKNSWGLADMGSGRKLYLVLFERVSDDALAGIIMVSSSSLVFLDFKGSYKDEDSVWRVSDGGEINDTMFSVKYAFEGKNGVEFAYGWQGPEGESIALVQQSAGQFIQLLDSYRYYF